ncbi:MAG: hypothetical protein WDW38_009356 [Sanguina aurantia]
MLSGSRQSSLIPALTTILTSSTTTPHLRLQQLLASAGFHGDTASLFTGVGVSDHPFLAWLADTLTIEDNFLSTADSDLADCIEGKRLYEFLGAEDEDLRTQPDQDSTSAQQPYSIASYSNNTDVDACTEPSLSAVFAQANLHAAAPWLAAQQHTETELRADINDLKRQISMLLGHIREMQQLNSALDGLALSGQAERAAAEGRNLTLRSAVTKLQGALADSSEQLQLGWVPQLAAQGRCNKTHERKRSIDSQDGAAPCSAQPPYLKLRSGAALCGSSLPAWHRAGHVVAVVQHRHVKGCESPAVSRKGLGVTPEDPPMGLAPPLAPTATPPVQVDLRLRALAGCVSELAALLGDSSVSAKWLLGANNLQLYLQHEYRVVGLFTR